jgi:hypothetical protein
MAGSTAQLSFLFKFTLIWGSHVLGQSNAGFQTAYLKVLDMFALGSQTRYSLHSEDSQVKQADMTWISDRFQIK